MSERIVVEVPLGIRGRRGLPGAPGASALELYREEQGDPTITRAQFLDAIAAGAVGQVGGLAQAAADSAEAARVSETRAGVDRGEAAGSRTAAEQAAGAAAASAQAATAKAGAAAASATVADAAREQAQTAADDAQEAADEARATMDAFGLRTVLTDADPLPAPVEDAQTGVWTIYLPAPGVAVGSGNTAPSVPDVTLTFAIPTAGHAITGASYTPEGGATLLDGASDADGDTITVTALNGVTSGSPLAYEAAGLRLEVSPDGIASLTTTGGDLVNHPAAQDATGTAASLTFTASDGTDAVTRSLALVARGVAPAAGGGSGGSGSTGGGTGGGTGAGFDLLTRRLERPIDDGTQAQTLTYEGVTITFDRVVPTGFDEAGRPWASAEGAPLGVVAISPGVTGSGTALRGGAMLDPVRAELHYPGEDVSTLGLRQTLNFRGPRRQGYTGRTGDPAQNYEEYDAALNVHPDVGGTLTLDQGTIVVAKAADGQMVPFTILAERPRVGDVLPGPSRADKTPRVNVVDFDWSRLPQRTPPTGFTAPTFDVLRHMLQVYFTDQETYQVQALNTWSTGRFEDRNGEIPELALSSYPSDWAGVLAAAAWWLVYGGGTAAQRTELAALLASHAEVFAARREEGGINWPNGGHAVGRLLPRLVLALLTGLRHYRDTARLKVEAAEGVPKFGKTMVQGTAVDGELSQLFTITAAHIDDTSGSSYPYATSQEGWPEWGGDEGRDPFSSQNTLGNKNTGNVAGGSGYRHNVADGLTVIGLLANVLPGFGSILEPADMRLLADYADRYMLYELFDEGWVATVPNPDTRADRNHRAAPWTIAAYQRDVLDAGLPTWTVAGGSPERDFGQPTTATAGPSRTFLIEREAGAGEAVTITGGGATLLVIDAAGVATAEGGATVVTLTADSTYHLDAGAVVSATVRGPATALPMAPPAPDLGAGAAATALSLDDFTQDRGLWDSGAAIGLHHAEVPVRGTTDPGVVVQARAVDEADAPRGPWVDVAVADGSGAFAGTLGVGLQRPWMRIEARAKDTTGVTAQTAARLGVGHVVAVWGQSELQHAIEAVHDLAPHETIPAEAEEMVCVAWHDRETPGSGAAGVQRVFVTDAQQVTGAIGAMAGALTATAPGERFLIVVHAKGGTDWPQAMSDDGADRRFADEAAIRGTAFADGQRRALVASSWTHSPGVAGSWFEEHHLPILTGRNKDGSAAAIPGPIRDREHNASSTRQVDHALPELYDFEDGCRIAYYGPHRFGPRGETLRDAVTLADGSGWSWAESREATRASLREMVANPTAVTSTGEPIFLPVLMEMLNYADGEDPQGDGTFEDVTHPSADIPEGLQRRMKLHAHAWARALGRTDWPDPVWTHHRREATGAWVEWSCAAGPVTTERVANGLDRPTPPDGYDASHWTHLVGFEIDGEPARHVEIVDGRARIFPPEGTTWGTDYMSRITHGRGGASGMLNTNEDRAAELFRDVAIVDFGLAGVPGVSIRAQIAPTIEGAAQHAGGDTATGAGGGTGGGGTGGGTTATLDAITAPTTASDPLVLHYSEPMQRGGGGILSAFYATDEPDTSAPFEDWPLTAAPTSGPGSIAIDGGDVTLTPSAPWPTDVGLVLLVDPGALLDADGDDGPDLTDWSVAFQVPAGSGGGGGGGTAPDVTNPALDKPRCSPPGGGTLSGPLTVTLAWTGKIAAGSGLFLLRSGNATIETVGVDDAAKVTFGADDGRVTIAFATAPASGTEYAIRTQPGTLVGFDGAPAEQLSNDFHYVFTAA